MKLGLNLNHIYTLESFVSKILMEHAYGFYCMLLRSWTISGNKGYSVYVWHAYKLYFPFHDGKRIVLSRFGFHIEHGLIQKISSDANDVTQVIRCK